jgi:hypothetical protein
MEDGVEVRIAHLEGVVMGLECRARVEVQDKHVVHPDGRKVRDSGIYLQPEDARENPADASLSCAGTIVWSSTIGMAMSLECFPPVSDAHRSMCSAPGETTPLADYRVGGTATPRRRCWCRPPRSCRTSRAKW